MDGISWTHGGHQVAQTFTNSTFPLSEERLTSLPSATLSRGQLRSTGGKTGSPLLLLALLLASVGRLKYWGPARTPTMPASASSPRKNRATPGIRRTNANPPMSPQVTRTTDASSPKKSHCKAIARSGFSMLGVPSSIQGFYEQTVRCQSSILRCKCRRSRILFRRLGRIGDFLLLLFHRDFVPGRSEE